MNDTNSTDPRVLVAGGSGGVGAAIARALAEDGWQVILTYRHNQAKAEKTAEEILSAGGSASTVRMDLDDRSGTARTVEDLGAESPLSGVVYAAGPVFPMQYISQIDAGYFADTVGGDVFGCYSVLQPAIPQLRQTGGTILSVSTPAAKRYAKKDVLSAAPKAAVEQIIKGIAAEEGRFGIRANCVAVGLLEGEGMWEQLIANGDYTPELLEAARRNTALGTFGDVADIAEAARFLMSTRAKWITGQTLAVDGGYTL